MKTLQIVAFLLFLIIPVLASPTAQQSAARSLPSKELVEMLRNAAKQNGDLRLTISKIEHILGNSDSIEKSKRWNDADEYIFKLSGGRWLEVTKAKKSIYEAILIDGKKRWLVWK